MPGTHRTHVVIAGSGPAAIEAALVLRRLASEQVETTILTPDEQCVRLPMSALVPFARSGSARHPLADLVAEAGATVRSAAVASVDPPSRELRTSDGDVVGYDALLIAVGAVHESPFPRALTFGRTGSEERMHGLIQDVEDGYVKRIAFVLAQGLSWPLPLYELALLTAERAYDACARVELMLFTPEKAPLELFGPGPSREVADLLAAAGIELRTRADVRVPRSNLIELGPRQQQMSVDRVITLPTLTGPAIEGLAHDAAGFLPTDAHGRVVGAPGVYAAGDATSHPIKQGGIACQQADAAAEAIAACAGVRLEPAPFTPVLRAVLVTEHDTRFLQRDLGTEADGTITTAQPPECPAWGKLAGRELSDYLDRVAAHSP